MAEYSDRREDTREDDTLILPPTEGVVREGASPAGNSHREANDETRLTLSNEELVISKRQVSSGAVDIHKWVETEHVRQTVPFTREEVTVERVTAPPGMGTEMVVDGDETRIPLVEEELVVQKRLVIREMLVIRKRQIQEEQIVEADLRHERADVNAEGNVHEVEDESE